MTRVNIKQDLERAKESLKDLKPGDILYFKLVKNSATGARRYYDVYQVATNPYHDPPRPEIYRITWSVSLLTGYNYSDAQEALYVNGGGFSATDEIRRALGLALFQDVDAFEERRL